MPILSSLNQEKEKTLWGKKKDAMLLKKKKGFNLLSVSFSQEERSGQLS